MSKSFWLKFTSIFMRLPHFLLLCPSVRQAHLHTAGVHAHARCLAHAGQSLCCFGKIVSHHTAVLPSAAHAAQAGAQHCCVDDLLQETDHKHVSYTKSRFIFWLNWMHQIYWRKQGLNQGQLSLEAVYPQATLWWKCMPHLSSIRLSIWQPCTIIQQIENN